MGNPFSINGGNSTLVFSVYICFFVLCSALYTDIKSHVIPNLLTIPVIICGFLYHIMPQHEGFVFAFKGFIVGIGVLLLPFLLGGMGGGDVKLLAAMGTWLGPEVIFNVFLYGAICGGVIALFFMFFGISGLKKLKNVLDDIKLFILIGSSLHSGETKNFPYSIPIFMGFIFYLIYGSAV